MLFRLFFIFLFLGCTFLTAQSIEDEKILRHQINTFYQKNYKSCTFQTKIAVTQALDKTELWKVCLLENGNRIIQIESHSKEIFYQEIYFEEKGQLR